MKKLASAVFAAVAMAIAEFFKVDESSGCYGGCVGLLGGVLGRAVDPDGVGQVEDLRRAGRAEPVRVRAGPRSARPDDRRPCRRPIRSAHRQECVARCRYDDVHGCTTLVNVSMNCLASASDPKRSGTFRSVLEGLEQRLRVRVVIGYPRPRMRAGHLEIGKQRRDGLTRHRRTPIRVHDLRDTLHRKDSVHHLRGQHPRLVRCTCAPTM